MISHLVKTGGHVMTANDQIALTIKLKEAWKERAPDMDEGEFFELFAAEQVLKDYYPTDEELAAGQVGGDDDGGLDSVYFLVDKEFVSDDTELDPKVIGRADLILIQATREGGFNETRVKNLNLLTEDFLNLSRGQGQLAGHYNDDVKSAMAIFKEKYKALLSAQDWTFSIKYYYICKGDTDCINTSLSKQNDSVIAKAKELFPKAETSFVFIGAAELLNLISRNTRKKYPLPLTEAPISPKKQKAWVCLVPIIEWYNFISNDGQIRHEFLEDNVRDWESESAPVNEAIKQSLDDHSPTREEDFWWLNNGITVLAASASNEGGQILTVETPRIVNGLQTSRCIFNYVSGLQNRDSETRSVLVRVIEAKGAESADHIIKATNSQTAVPPYRLHMTEKIHRDIETVLSSYGLFYDRRKNFHKNENKPIARIVQPLNLAQTIMSVLLQKPDDARARPTTLLKQEYEKVFATHYPLEMYANCAVLMKKVDGFLQSKELALTRNQRLNLRWYVAMVYARMIRDSQVPALTGQLPKANHFQATNIPKDEVLLKQAFDSVNAKYQALGASDKVAKGPELATQLSLSAKDV
jgi:hypothetical protein